MPAPSTATTVTSVSPIVSAARGRGRRCGPRVAGRRCAERPAATGQAAAGSGAPASRSSSTATSLGAAICRAMAANSPRRPGVVRARSLDGAAPRPRGRRRSAATRVARRAGTRLASERDARCRAPSRRARCATATTSGSSSRSAASTPSDSTSAHHALRDPVADHEPDRGGDDPEHEALEHDRAHDLPARGAERAQRGELTRALGDRDRQRVEDHERADEQRDAAEDQQERSGSSRHRAVPVALGLVDRAWPMLLTCRSAGEQRLDGAHELRPRDVPGLALIDSTSKRPARCSSFWADLMSQTATLAVAEAGPRRGRTTVPASLKVWRLPSVEITIASPTLKCCVGRGVAVDDDLPRALGPTCRTRA